MNTYKVLSKQSFKEGEYSLVPIRYEDRYAIMQWRNEQIYHLRQSEPLTKERQEWYFDNIVNKLFDQEKPDQVLFSFLKGSQCIGYGGLVHINWRDANAEVSFLIKTSFQDDDFENLWAIYLNLIKYVAFAELNLLKIFTVAYDLRPRLYPVLKEAGFRIEGEFRGQTIFNGRPIKVYQHSFFNPIIELNAVTEKDVDITYEWARKREVRKYAISQDEIDRAEHVDWFEKQLRDPQSYFFIAVWRDWKVGSFRLNVNDQGEGIVSYLLDSDFHGLGLGRILLESGVKKAHGIKEIHNLFAKVFKENEVSVHLFKALGFSLIDEEQNLLTFKLDIK